MTNYSKYFLFAIICLGMTCAASAADRPNIILILADDLGYSDLGCYGGEIDTPNIDALASGGVRFTQLYNSARCCPSRASLMTGLYPSQAGIGDFTTSKPSPTRGPGYLGRLTDQCVTLAEALKPAGYGCYYVGKWHMHPETGPIRRGFDEFYGFTNDHSHDQYDAEYYIRLPEGHAKEFDPPQGEFYATDVFNDYAMEFIRQGQKSGKPWFLFLGHSSPHFPVQAPVERADKYEATYLRGWDVLRDERYERMQQIGLIDGPRWKLTPRSIVPVDRDDIANGYSGQQNPAWDSLDEDRQHDLARRMSVFAAMVERVDYGVGNIVEHLKSTGDFDNTLILFLSDNGACYEWGPFGFDGVSRQGTTTLHTGDDLRKIGGPGTHHSYGSAWANLGNTPFRLYKHFTNEGGISTPFIAHWPKGIGNADKWVRDPAHVMDIMPTIIDAAGASYPTEFHGNDIPPMEGTSLLPAMRGEHLPERVIGFDHQAAHALRQGDWKIVWSKRMPHEIQWELYNLAEDRCETNDLAETNPDRVATMAAEWEQWAKHVGVTYDPFNKAPDTDSPMIANRSLTITGHVQTDASTGVIVAQDGREHGYAVHLIQGKMAFDVRVNGEVTRIIAKESAPKEFDFEAILTTKTMSLAIGGVQVAEVKSPGLIPMQPKDGMNIGYDDLTAAGDYISPNPLKGKVEKIKVTPGEVIAEPPKPAPANVAPVQEETGDSTKPFQSELITKWGEEVTPENAWTEYPRPQLVRDAWQNLNGEWDYAVTAVDDQKTPEAWAGKILVPYCLESKLGGVQRLLDATEALWYHRTFECTQSSDIRTLLNFEAVDYRCEIFVNGTSVGSHQGGNIPFSLDITHAVHDGENELVVRVEDETEAWQLRGKQVLNARGIWYTQVSGIWQTVWLEQVPSAYIADLKITTDAGAGSITVAPIIEGIKQPFPIEINVCDGEKQVAHVSYDKADRYIINLKDAKLWSPDSPHLYDIEVTMMDENRKPIDQVRSYAGIRSVGKVKDADGNWRFTLNGKVIFHWGPLDQGWWPDGLLTPPSDEAMLSDIEYLKAAGFNMIRKHIKVEPRRYYYHCDRLGMMLWQDQVSGGESPKWTRLTPDPVDAEWPEEHHRQFMIELDRMISNLENHPSIVCWVPFNEAWGQHQTVEVGRWTAERDPSRLVNIASGGNFWPAGDIVDSHRYPHPGFPFEQNENGRFDDFIKVMGEFGGHGYPVPGHLWDANRRNWGYGGLPQNKEEYMERYVTSLNMLNELRAEGISAGVYTQTTDVEGEINGLMTYDRKVKKIPAEELAELHKILFTDEPVVATVPADAKEIPEKKSKPTVDKEAVRAGLESHDHAIYIKTGWIRDPYIFLAPDGYYYLTGTTPNPCEPREAEDPHNTGLGEESIVGYHMQLWRTRDLIDWEYLGVPFSLLDGYWAQKQPEAFRGDRSDWRLWAPEVHFFDGRWYIVHTTPGPVKRGSNLAVTQGDEIKGPYSFPLADLSGGHHDPSLFRDDDGTIYLLWQNTMIAPLTADMTGFSADPVRIDPSGSRPGPGGNPISQIGHEGATMRKIGGKYVHFGTAWSTDQGRKGSYNLYYCTADSISGPYGPRRFVGRFLGHGTPFQDKKGNWWCTAFYNANVPPLPREGIETRNLGENAQTINEQGVTIVPLDVRVLDNGEVTIRAKDPAYATPGPDESQQIFE